MSICMCMCAVYDTVLTLSYRGSYDSTPSCICMLYAVLCSGCLQWVMTAKCACVYLSECVCTCVSITMLGAIYLFENKVILKLLMAFLRYTLCGFC